MAKNINLCDPDLIVNDTDKQNYTCNGCSKIAQSAKVLGCDVKYHDEAAALYCGICANTMIEKNQCVLKRHPNPAFIDAEMMQRRIRHMGVVCIYSKQYRSISEAQRRGDNVAANVIFDTIEIEGKYSEERPNIHHSYIEKHKENVRDCPWKGEYVNLEDHIKNECLYKPITCPFDECKRNTSDYICKATKALHLECNISYHLGLLNEATKSMDESTQQSTHSIEELRVCIGILNERLDQMETQRKISTQYDMDTTINIRVCVFVLLIVAVAVGVQYI